MSTTLEKELEIAIVDLRLAEATVRKITRLDQTLNPKRKYHSRDWSDAKVAEFEAWHRVQKIKTLILARSQCQN